MTMKEIQELWRQHQAAPSPEGISGDEIEGWDLVCLDSFAAGCISTFVGSSGRLDSDQIECLIGCRESMSNVLPKLTGEAQTYYYRLHQMTDIALRSLGK